MPDYSSDFFFFLQTTILTLIGPLFTILSRAPEAKSAQGKLYSKGSPLSFFTFSRKHTKPDVPKRSPLWIFFGTVRLFFENFLMSPKGPPFEFFVILQQNACLEIKKGPLFYIFRHCATFSERIFFPKISSFFSKKMFCAF